jgi:hypothetical protein
MDDQRVWVLRNSFLWNFRETFHRDETDVTKETSRLRGEAFFKSEYQKLCSKFTIKEFQTTQSL